MLALSSCQAPALEIAVDEPDAKILVDGEEVGAGRATVPFRYYGTAALTVVPLRHALDEDLRPPLRRTVGLPAPAPGWLFPFDFFVELWRRRLAEPEPEQVAVELPPAATTLVPGRLPPRPEGLRERARRAQVGR